MTSKDVVVLDGGSNEEDVVELTPSSALSSSSTRKRQRNRAHFVRGDDRGGTHIDVVDITASPMLLKKKVPTFDLTEDLFTSKVSSSMSPLSSSLTPTPSPVAVSSSMTSRKKKRQKKNNSDSVDVFDLTSSSSKVASQFDAWRKKEKTPPPKNPIDVDLEDDDIEFVGSQKRNPVKTPPNTSMNSDRPQKYVLKEDVDNAFKMRANERNELLGAVFPDASSGLLERCRRQSERTSSLVRSSLWALVEACAKHKKVQRLHLTSINENKHFTLSFRSLVPVAPDNHTIHARAAVRYFRKRVAAMYAEETFLKTLEGIKEVDSEEEEDGDGCAAESDVRRHGENKRRYTVTCSICMCDFNVDDAVSCSNASKPHCLCKPCFRQYCASTLLPRGIGIASVPCANTECKKASGHPNLFDPAVVRRNLSPLDIMRMDESETSRSRRVALAGAAKLFCSCGTVGVVLESDMGNGIVKCPGCSKKYCAKCGNKDHGKSPCPPPSDMLQWLKKKKNKSKQCPNCGMGVQKNGGCMHMTCSRQAGGCGYEFCWKCLGKFPKCDCGHFNRESRRVANGLARRWPRPLPSPPELRGAGRWFGG